MNLAPDTTGIAAGRPNQSMESRTCCSSLQETGKQLEEIGRDGLIGTVDRLKTAKPSHLGVCHEISVLVFHAWHLTQCHQDGRRQ